MLRITTEKKRGKIFLGVEGRLAGPWVAALEQCWRELHAASPRERFHVNLCGVSFIDAAGKMLLMEMHRQGGQLLAEGCLNQAIVDEIVAQEKKSASSGTKERPKRSHIIFYTALFSLMLAPAATHAQDTNKQSALPGNAPTGVLRLTLDQAVGLAVAIDRQRADHAVLAGLDQGQADPLVVLTHRGVEHLDGESGHVGGHRHLP